jgi:hypothetical protein
LHLTFYAYGSDLSFSGFSRLWSGCGGERGATPLGWQAANIGGHGFWTVGAPSRIRVAVKNGRHADLIALEEDAASMLTAEIPRFVIAKFAGNNR